MHHVCLFEYQGKQSFLKSLWWEQSEDLVYVLNRDFLAPNRTPQTSYGYIDVATNTLMTGNSEDDSLVAINIPIEKLVGIQSNKWMGDDLQFFQSGTEKCNASMLDDFTVGGTVVKKGLIVHYRKCVGHKCNEPKDDFMDGDPLTYCSTGDFLIKWASIVIKCFAFNHRELVDLFL